LSGQTEEEEEKGTICFLFIREKGRDERKIAHLFSDLKRKGEVGAPSLLSTFGSKRGGGSNFSPPSLDRKKKRRLPS